MSMPILLAMLAVWIPAGYLISYQTTIICLVVLLGFQLMLNRGKT